MPTHRDEGARGHRAEPGDGAVLGLERPGDAGGIRRFSHEAMASVFEVHVDHPDARYASQAARAAFDLTDRLEQELSRFVGNSDVTRINHLAAGEQTRVGAATMECLAIARHVYDLTGGVFDVSLGTGLPSLEFEPGDLRVRTTQGGLRIDLGGIGKGYAVDRMAEVLEEWGLGRALVHGGFSSVLALDPPNGRDGWPLTLSDPGGAGRVLARISVRQTALGASGLRKGDHIVDPRTGQPVGGRRAAWAAVPRPEPTVAGDGRRLAAAAITDALATAFMSLAAAEIEELCERSPGLEAWVVPVPASEEGGEVRLLHFGGPAD
jgi:FAD:protein FMN transferase